eukprot:Rhum_TRINITY_DN14346_c11_g1::Rhum_TRINITY_DN14346_c11_g1_i1::g.79935::m.79935
MGNLRLQRDLTRVGGIGWWRRVCGGGEVAKNCLHKNGRKKKKNNDTAHNFFFYILFYLADAFPSSSSGLLSAKRVPLRATAAAVPQVVLRLLVTSVPLLRLLKPAEHLTAHPAVVALVVVLRQPRPERALLHLVASGVVGHHPAQRLVVRHRRVGGQHLRLGRRLDVQLLELFLLPLQRALAREQPLHHLVGVDRPGARRAHGGARAPRLAVDVAVRRQLHRRRHVELAPLHVGDVVLEALVERRRVRHAAPERLLLLLRHGPPVLPHTAPVLLTLPLRLQLLLRLPPQPRRRAAAAAAAAALLRRRLRGELVARVVVAAPGRVPLPLLAERLRPVHVAAVERGDLRLQLRRRRRPRPPHGDVAQPQLPQQLVAVRHGERELDGRGCCRLGCRRRRRRRARKAEARPPRRRSPRG